MQVQRERGVGGSNQTVWRLEPSYTTVEFSVRNLFFFKVSGRLTVLDGSIVLDERDIHKSSVGATLDAGSVDTGIKRRDAHLCSAALLDADKYPEIHFQSSRVGPGIDRDMLSVSGSLRIKEQSSTIELDVTEVDRSLSPRGEEVIYFSATTELDRFDFGINYGRGVIGRSLKITINVQASRRIKADLQS
jgi:polyisoprenoid-binding protein YceI